jgi:hypothetical protein
MKEITKEERKNRMKNCVKEGRKEGRKEERKTFGYLLLLYNVKLIQNCQMT